MRYLSTRDATKTYALSEALELGICPSGGLFVPETLPQFDLKSFSSHDDFTAFSEKLLRPFFIDDQLEKDLSGIVNDAFTFPVLWRELENKHYLLELFHGPTAAFKDFGARFLASCFLKLGHKKTILVATSGDTGGAVASAFYKKKNLKVVILFPKDAVSPLQKKQLTCWGENVLSLEVEGDFDSCQKLVKEAFLEENGQKKFALTSANSINIGRLLPQITYYAYSAYHLFLKLGRPINFIIPSGNMGNGMAAVWCKQMGLPIGKIHFACNQNRPIYDFFEIGKLTPRPSIKTLANAMDVGNPSNMERLIFNTKKTPSILSDLAASWNSDEEIAKTIQHYHKKHHLFVCPHTAVALCACHKFFHGEVAVSVATAHPYKFNEVMTQILGEKTISAPEPLADLCNRSSVFESMKPELQALQKKLEHF